MKNKNKKIASSKEKKAFILVLEFLFAPRMGTFSCVVSFLVGSHLALSPL